MSHWFIQWFFCVVGPFNVKMCYNLKKGLNLLTTAITWTGVIEPVQTGQAAKDYLAKSVNPTLLKGLTELCKQKPIDPVVNNIY